MRELIEKLLEKNGEFQCQIILIIGDQISPIAGILKRGPVDGIYCMYSQVQPDPSQPSRKEYVNHYISPDRVAWLIEPVQSRIVPVSLNIS